MHAKIRVPPPMPSISASSPPARLKFWGTRGSIAVPGPETLRYGGNTTCVELRADGEIIVLDAGSGIRPLGIALDREFQARPIRLSLLITHAHWDHIQGFPFFKPAYDSKNEIRIFGFDGAGATFREIMTEPMKTPFFPITMRELSARTDINKLNEMKFSLGKLDIHAAFVNHPGVCVGYRIFTSGASVAFLPDHEPYEFFLHSTRGKQLSPEQAKEIAANQHAGLVQFLRGSDVLILDSQYTDQEYKAHIGWGHGSISSAVALALEAEVQTLVLFHHDPNHDDAMVDTMVESARELALKSGSHLEVVGAQQGSEILLEAKKIAAA
ncbi:MAG TPA: MBL fold metallo-hydrolase [Candidatus Udaeobacter sp.]|jgi:phosphoribosyl 1,2-cyclic phosphodiesterase|nr:MBL fold metallo-hydrolase [Candidatus Udaeobacter sp.]